MTTIAYRNGVMAADTLISRNGALSGYAKKIDKIGPVLVGACGCLSLDQRFRDWVRTGMRSYPPTLKVGDSEGCVVIIDPDGRIVEFNGDAPPDVIRSPFAAWGSGAPFALGAMAHGATAEEAVAAASGLDHSTGGEITVLRR